MIVQIYFITHVLLISCVAGTPPAGYQKRPEDSNKRSPKYEYAYKIENEKGAQGKVEARDGIYALGRYFVRGNEAAQNVRYFADDWGFHPYVQYSNNGADSRSLTHIAVGAEAVKSYRKQNQDVEPPQLAAQFDSLEQRINGKDGTSIEPLKTEDARLGTTVNSQLDVDEEQKRPSYVPPEQGQRITHVPIIFVQQHEQQQQQQQQEEQPPNFIHVNQPVNILEQQHTGAAKEATIYYVPIQNVLQADLYANDRLPTAQAYVQVPFEQSGSHLQLNPVASSVLIPQQDRQEIDKGAPSKAARLEDAINNDNVNGDAIESKAEFVPVRDQQFERQPINLQANQNALNVANEQQQLLTIQQQQQNDASSNSNVEQQKGSGDLNYLTGDRPVALPYVYLNQYADENKVATTNLQIAEDQVRQDAANKDVQAKEQTESSRIKELLNAEKSTNEELDSAVKQTAQQTLAIVNEELRNGVSQHKELEKLEGLTQQHQQQQEFVVDQQKDYVQQKDEFIQQQKEEFIQQQQEFAQQLIKQEQQAFAQQQQLIKQENQQQQQDENQHNFALLQEQPAYQSTEAPQQLQLTANYRGQSTKTDQNHHNQAVETTVNYAQQDGRTSIVDFTSTGNDNAVQEKDNLQTIYALEQLSGYGAKITAQNAASTSINPSKLIASTKNMVNGEDVLNINAIQFTETESSTANAIATDYSSSHNTVTSAGIVDTSQSLVDKLTIDDQQQFTTTTEATTVNLSEQPIVVEEEPANEQSLDVVVTSTTESSTSVRKGSETHAETTVVVTPRPVSTHFLAPITAGVRLQSLDYVPSGKENVYVEIQKSVPYYLGKVEYVQGESSSEKLTIKSAFDDLKDGHVLLGYDEKDVKRQFLASNSNCNCSETQATAEEVRNAQDASLPHGLTQQVPLPQHLAAKDASQVKKQSDHAFSLFENIQPSQELPLPQLLSTPSKISAEELNQQLSLQQMTKIEKDIIAAVANQEVTDADSNRYYVAVPSAKGEKATNHISEQHVHVPVPVLEPHAKIHTQIVEKPVRITEYVDRPYPVPVQVHVPVPYAVEKKVPVTVEKFVTKYVPQPYVVEKVVEKHVQVPVQVPVEVPVEVTKYVDRPYPVPQPVPYPVEIAPPPPVPTDKPYVINAKNKNAKPIHQSAPYTHQPIHVDVPKYIDQILKKPVPVYYLNDNKLQSTSYPSQYLYAPNYHPSVKCDQEAAHSANYHTINPDDYIGLTPPKLPSGTTRNVRLDEGRVRQNRGARHDFGKNLRIEYGFMPPLVPSLEIDENGDPVARSNN